MIGQNAATILEIANGATALILCSCIFLLLRAMAIGGKPEDFSKK